MKAFTFIHTGILWFLLLANAQTGRSQTNHVRIQAHIDGLPAGQWIYLIQSKPQSLDSVQSIAGGFSFEKDILRGNGNIYSLSIANDYMDPYKQIRLYLDTADIIINGKGPYFKDVSFSGAPSIMDYNDYIHYLEATPGNQQLDTLRKQSTAAFIKKDTLALMAVSDKIKTIYHHRDERTIDWVMQHFSSPISAYILETKRFDLGIEKTAAIFNQLSPVAKNNIPGKNLQHSIRMHRITAIGKTAPALSQPDSTGKLITLKSFKGSYVLVDFWASWCGPCRAENPNVVRVYHKYKNKGLHILGVSLDLPRSKDSWLAAIKKDGLTWPQVSDLKGWANQAAKAYGVEAIPANFLVDPQGVIIAKNLRGPALEKKMEEIMQD